VSKEEQQRVLSTLHVSPGDSEHTGMRVTEGLPVVRRRRMLNERVSLKELWYGHNSRGEEIERREFSQR
jgi:hypothetical protein